MLKFNLRYFTFFVIILFVEILIAKFGTGFIRHTIGDVFATILLYFIIKSIFAISNYKAILISLAIAFIIEFLQLTNLQNLYPKQYSNTLKLMLGTSFSIGDIIAYTIGILIVYTIENHSKK